MFLDLYDKIDALFELKENEQVTFEQDNLNGDRANKTLIDVIKIENEPGKINASYGVYFHEVTEVVEVELPKVLPRPIRKVALNKIGFGFFNKIRRIIKLIKFIANVIGYLSSKCIRICPPWSSRVCGYSPTHGYRTFKNLCVFKRDVCRGASKWILF